MSKLIVFVAVALLAAVYAQEHWWAKPVERQADLHPDVANKTHFGHWMKKHGHSYHADHVENRYKQWKASVQAIWTLNQRTNATWVAGLNRMSAHTNEERRAMLGAIPDMTNLPADNPGPVDETKRFRPDWIDWSQKGAVTSVKDQGQCGSCWSFSAAGALEGAMATSGKQIADLSPQEIIDCAGLGSCGGADPFAATRWGGKNGMSYWNEYPYQAKATGCHSSAKHFWCNDLATSTNGNDGSAADIIASGPASICFHVNDDFFHYSGGVYSEACDHSINHAVVAVGYAKNCANSGKDCYILKNQWGTSFGTGGYFLMQMGNNMCNIAGYVSRPYNCRT